MDRKHRSKRLDGVVVCFCVCVRVCLGYGLGLGLHHNRNIKYPQCERQLLRHRRHLPTLAPSYLVLKVDVGFATEHYFCDAAMRHPACPLKSRVSVIASLMQGGCTDHE